MDLDLGSVMFFLGCAMAINGEKLPEACRAPTNSVGRRESNTAEVQLPSLVNYLFAKH